jgi:mono/diheme cytochrome c family protein
LNLRPAAGFLAALLALGLTGCPGDGSALVDDIIDGGGNGGDDAPTLAQIQQTIFTPRCTDCHIATGQGGFMLLDSEDASFASLVGVESLLAGPLLRVAPGDPEQSFLVHKIEGRRGIPGNRMPPPPLDPLTPEQITMIRDWIEAGALR